MVTKEMLKARIDELPQDDLEAVYRFMISANLESPTGNARKMEKVDWAAFIESTFGCMADAPITRGSQGTFESRESVE